MKTAFITGANRGLGFGFVEYLLSEGYVVFAGTRNITDALPQKENLIWIECDVTDDASISRAVEEVKKKTDRLTLLVNNAGTNKDTIPEGNKNLVSKLGHLDRKALVGMFNINAISPIMVTQAFLLLLTDTPSFVINISSMNGSFNMGRFGSTANYGYNSSKAALNMMTLCSLVDLLEHVKTFTFHPGGVKTDMNPDGQGDPLERAKDALAFVNNWKEEYNGKLLHHNGTIHLF